MGNSNYPVTKTVTQIAFILICFGLLIIPAFTKMPALVDFLQPPSTLFAAFPLLDHYKNFLLFPPAYQDHFDQHFLFHDSLVQWNYDLEARLVNGNVFPGVVAGKEDWLFLSDEDNITDYQCVEPFNEQELQAIVKNVKSMREELESQGIVFIVIISPNKESIYSEFLPENVQKLGSLCRMDQVIDSLNDSGEEILDLRNVILPLKETQQLYYKTDTHWNDIGAYLAYQAVANNLQMEIPELKPWEMTDFTLSKRTFQGDLSRLIPMHRPFEEESVFLEPISPRRAIISEGNDWRTIISTVPGSELPKAVVFRDSFFMGLLPFFAEHFSRAVYEWSFDVDEELIQNEKPDIVIFEIAQRYLHVLTQ